jgi:hypothetical protein
VAVREFSATGGLTPSSPAAPTVWASEPSNQTVAVLPASVAYQQQPTPAAQPVEPQYLAPRRNTTPREQPIDLASALELTAGQNPEVNFARQRIQEAFAQLDAASVLWVPSLRAG